MVRRLFPIIVWCISSSLIDARSVLMDPRPAQVGFAEKVDTYVRMIHARTAKDGVGQVLSKAVFLAPTSPMKSITAILGDLGPHLIRDKNVADQEACSASLIKILVPVVTQFEQALFGGIHAIEHALAYWQYQELHPASYYFHKEPLKYFTLDQKEEVARKIQALKKMREQHFELLGRINIQLSSFDAQIAVQEQYVWIQKLCRVLFAYNETIQVAEDAEIFPLLYEATNIVPHYYAYLNEKLDTYELPSLFARRWIELMGGIAAVTYGGRYAYKHQEILKNFYNNKAVLVKEIVFGKSDDVSVNRQYEEYLAKWKASVSEHGTVQRVQDKIKVEGIKKSEVIGTMIGAYFDIGVEGCRHVVEAFAAIGHAFADGEQRAGIAERMARYVLAGTDTVRANIGRAASSLGGKKESPSPLPSSSSSSSFSSSSEVPESRELPFPVSESLHEVYKTGKLWVALQKVENPRIWGLIRSAPFTVPAGFMSWRLLKLLYKKYNTPLSCEPIRIALVDMALILNVYGDALPTEMDATDFGRLAYLAHTLELDISLIPKQYRESFLIEVGLLRTSSLNAQQKMRVIDLMYKKYPFLAFQGMKTA